MFSFVAVAQQTMVNDGTSDIGQSPNYILLVRGLDPLTNEESVLFAMLTLG